VKEVIKTELTALMKIDAATRTRQRQDKFCAMGVVVGA
jgi:acetyl-CoA carboxylase alpha subunit